MSSTIPVFFAVVEPQVSFPPGATAEDAYGTEALDRLHQAGDMWEAASRNWWHLSVTRDIAQDRGITGLEFLEEECVTVSAGDLPGAIRAIDELLAGLADDRAATEAQDDYAALVRDRRYLAELPTLAPQKEIYEFSDDAVDAVSRRRSQAVSYYRFLLSLRAVAQQALDGEKAMLWIMPMP